MKILFVDDNEVILEIYRDEIQDAFPEVQVLTAINGKEAVDIFEKHHPTYIFTDGKMPGMNGLELANELTKHEISQKNQPPKIFMITGHFDSISKELGPESNISKVFDKPIDFDELIDFIKSFYS